MDFPFPNNAPAGDTPGATTDDFWGFNPQQPPPMDGQADDTSLDELLALYQTAQDAPPAPFAPMGEPDSYPFDPAAAGGDFGFGAPGGFGDPATDTPFPAFGGGDDAFPGFDAAGAAFGADAPAFPAFGDTAAPAADFGFDAGAPAADAFPAFDAAPAPGGFDLGGADDPFGLPPAAPETGFGGFESVVPEAPAFGGDFNLDAGAAELPADFGDLGGPVFPAFDAAGAAFDAAGAAFGEEPAAELPAFDAPAGGMEFPAFDAAPADGGMEFPAFDAGPTFPAFDAAPAAEAAPVDFGDLGGPVFAAFGDEPAATTEFPAFGAGPADGGMEFPAFDAAGAAFDEDAPLFPPLEPAAEAPAAPAAPAMPAAPAGAFSFDEEEPQEFVPDEDAPLFPSLDDGSVFPAFDAPAAEAPVATPAPEPVAEFPAFDAPAASFDAPPFDAPAFPASGEPEEALPAEDFDFSPPAGGPVFAAIEPEPVAPVQPEPVIQAAPTPPAAPVVPSVDPEQTLRYREVPAAPAASAGPSLDLATLANLTGKQVVVRTTDDRRVANQQLTQVVGALATGLDDIQGRMAHLYADLQGAAVSRAPVDEIQRITTELAQAKASVGEGSDLHKQALYLRQMADAYLQMLKDL
ncbi:MAG: hypothetical protein ACK46X_04045 [Candidatus Sericytochromatia bacterium]